MLRKSDHPNGLRITPDARGIGTFEIKTADGRALGFVMNGQSNESSFVIAGSGAAIRSVFQQVLMWPATKVINARLALILMDKIEGESATPTLREMTDMLAPVQDYLFLPVIETEQTQTAPAALRAIENFCHKHGVISERSDRPARPRHEARMHKRPPKRMIGWRETVSLPDLGLAPFPAKIDTGARTTALHATDLQFYEVDGRPWVAFTPDHDGLTQAVRCALPVHHHRAITNTSGIPEDRVVVISTLRLGDQAARIEISLSDRADMKYPMIAGRTALRQLRLTVDPARSWLLSSRPSTEKDMS